MKATSTPELGLQGGMITSWFLDRSREIADLERDVGDGLHEFVVRRLVPVAHPLDAERIAVVIATRQVELGKRDLAVEGLVSGDPNMVEPHERTTRRLHDQVTRISPGPCVEDRSRANERR
jgi:hypothetical protein